MPAKFVQLEIHDSGTAQLQISGPSAGRFSDPATIEIAIIQPGQGERFLDPRDQADPWKLGAFHFRPLRPTRTDAGLLTFEIDHAVTYHLRAMTPYFVRVRVRPAWDDDGADAGVQEVFTMPPTTRRPSAQPTGWVEPPDPQSPAGLPVNPPRPVGATSTPADPSLLSGSLSGEGPPPFAGPSGQTEPVDSRAGNGLVSDPAPAGVRPSQPIAPPPVNPRRSGALIAATVLVLLMAAGLAAWLVLRGDSSTDGNPAPSVAAGTPQSMDACRQAIAAAPTPEQTRDWALEMARGKRLLDCQFLLFRFAAEKGDAVSARSIGLFYDPDTWSRESSPLPSPNPAEASRWHKQAAEAGDAESMYRYGMLLKLGRTELEQDQAQSLGRDFLQRALAAGHPLAAAALQ
jgi:hypothetical protein